MWGFDFFQLCGSKKEKSFISSSSLWLQVCDAYKNKKHQETWWLEALQQIKQDKETVDELTRKIENAVLRSRDVSNSSRSVSQ